MKIVSDDVETDAIYLMMMTLKATMVAWFLGIIIFIAEITAIVVGCFIVQFYFKKLQTCCLVI